jgi:hypothetical protein
MPFSVGTAVFGILAGFFVSKVRYIPFFSPFALSLGGAVELLCALNGAGVADRRISNPNADLFSSAASFSSAFLQVKRCRETIIVSYAFCTLGFALLATLNENSNRFVLFLPLSFPTNFSLPHIALRKSSTPSSPLWGWDRFSNNFISPFSRLCPLRTWPLQPAALDW